MIAKTFDNTIGIDTPVRYRSRTIPGAGGIFPGWITRIRAIATHKNGPYVDIDYEVPGWILQRGGRAKKITSCLALGWWNRRHRGQS